MKYNTFLEAAENYLNYRRKMGFAIRIEGQELLRFAKYADSISHKEHITVELAIQWAKLPQKCSSIYWARRLDIVRRFAKYLKTIDAGTEVPPEGICGPSYCRKTPHIYTEEQIASLLNAARALTPLNGLRPNTYATLFGLLASTGIRISEALNLKDHDVNLENNIIIIRETKFHKSRIIPIHSTTSKALKYYVDKRNKAHASSISNAFFLTEKATSLKYHKTLMTFVSISYSLGWRSPKKRKGPRIHDLRHTFVVKRFLSWYRNGEDVNKQIYYLSTYLGHVKIADTYWYITAIPELMAIASSRFERFAGEVNNE